MKMKMTMNEIKYKDNLEKLNPGVLDTLRRVVEWVDMALVKNNSRKLTFREYDMEEESNLSGAIGAEAIGSVELNGISKINKLLKTHWQIFQDNQNGTLTLNYTKYILFRSALKIILKKQPFGYKKALAIISDIKEIKIIKQKGAIYIIINDNKPIYIAKDTEKQGKLLYLLNDPIGVPRSLESIAEILDSNDGETTIRNTVRELQRKLAEKGLRNMLSFSFKKTTLYMKIG